MSNEQNAVRERHLESLASAVADKFANFSGGTSDVFAGATANTAGLSGMVPAPVAGEQDRFLRGDGKWARVGTSGGADYVIGSDASSIEGGLWRDSINDVPVLKLRHGDYEYNFNYDSMTFLGGESIAIATVTPDTYVLGTDSVSSEGGLWFELSDDVPTLNLHAGSFNYGFNYDSITYKGGNSHLVSYLPFDSSTTADACGNEWTVNSGSPTLSTEIKKFGSASLYCPNGTQPRITANDILDFTAEKWTFDFWFYSASFGNVYFNLGGVYLYGAQGIVYGKNTNNHDETLANGSTITIPTNQWVHYALVKDGDTWRAFLNGVCYSTRSVAVSSLNFGNTFELGGSGGGTTNVAYLDSVRFFEGVALWTENFTVPTAADYA